MGSWGVRTRQCGKFTAALALFLLLFVSPVVAGTPAPPESFTLDNGMEVIVLPNHRVPAVSHMLWFRVGAADDPPGKSGLAHYHEHMMYQGSARYKSGEYSRIIAAKGGQENAFTGHDVTSYYINIAKENLPLAMELEADRMRGLSPSDADVLKEKDVILEERRMRIENSPAALLSEQMNVALFRHHPYRVPVIGWMHEMQGLTRQDVLDFHSRYYHPNNAILIISGDVTADEVKPLAQKYYGALPKKDLPPRRWAEEPPQNSARRIQLTHANVTQPVWYRDYAVPSLSYADKTQAMPLYVLAELLGGGKTSALYTALIVERKLATSVSVDYQGMALGPAQFSLAVVPAAGVSMEQIEVAVDEELGRFLSARIDDAKLQRTKTQLKAEAVFARDGLSAMANIMGWVRICGLDKDYFLRWPEMVDAVSPDQVLTAMRQSLKPEASVTGHLLPTATAKERE